MARSRRHFACPCGGAVSVSMCMSALNKLLNLLPLVKNGPSYSQRSRAANRPAEHKNVCCNALNWRVTGVQGNPANTYLPITIYYYLPFTICHRQPNGKLWPQPSDQLTTHQPGHIRLDLAMTALAFRPLIN